MQMMSGAGSSSPAAAASTIDGEHAGMQQCCYVGRAMLGGQWLENTNSAAYPCSISKLLRDQARWWSQGCMRLSRLEDDTCGRRFVVNSSARHCKRCQQKIQHAVRAVDTGGLGAAVDTSA